MFKITKFNSVVDFKEAVTTELNIRLKKELDNLSLDDKLNENFLNKIVSIFKKNKIKKIDNSYVNTIKLKDESIFNELKEAIKESIFVPVYTGDDPEWNFRVIYSKQLKKYNALSNFIAMNFDISIDDAAIMTNRDSYDILYVELTVATENTHDSFIFFSPKKVTIRKYT